MPSKQTASFSHGNNEQDVICSVGEREGNIVGTAVTGDVVGNGVVGVVGESVIGVPKVG